MQRAIVKGISLSSLPFLDCAYHFFQFTKCVSCEEVGEKLINKAIISLNLKKTENIKEI